MGCPKVSASGIGYDLAILGQRGVGNRDRRKGPDSDLIRTALKRLNTWRISGSALDKTLPDALGLAEFPSNFTVITMPPLNSP